MEIKRLTKNSFNGRLIAKSYNCIKKMDTNLDIYEVFKRDALFLKNMHEKIKIKDLFPNSGLPKDRLDRWQDMLEVAIEYFENNNEKTLLAVKDNKPCGILSYSKDKNSYFLDCICTWPVEIGKKVALAGQTLFKVFFEDFVSSSAKSIKLNAIINGPFDNIKKYSQLGFKENGAVGDHIISMSANRFKIEDKLIELNERIHTQNFDDSLDISLLDTLTI